MAPVTKPERQRAGAASCGPRCCGIVLAAIEELSERDREIVVLRAIEQHSNQDAAELLGIAPNTAAQAFGRALGRLREKLPGSVFDEL